MLEKFNICYHGTINDYADKIVDNIDITVGRTFTDFGQGFYVTNNNNQARKWALKKYYDYKEINRNLFPAIVIMKLDIEKLRQLSGQEYEVPSNQWAEFIFNCRKVGKRGGLYHHDDYACGPLADGKIVPLLKRLETQRISFEQFHQGILPYTEISNQLSLNTLQAIKCIKHMEVKRIDIK
ncbi:DUF3990 domain-containing protein [Radiobacillus sp. PE A8.2]|uniref:DUF3990 domain-containing protein n=1 Tax=Radiobacillus sp. PE A8.2 TaxID=3380349 RepID=UPI003890002E